MKKLLLVLAILTVISFTPRAKAEALTIPMEAYTLNNRNNLIVTGVIAGASCITTGILAYTVMNLAHLTTPVNNQ